MTLIGAKLQVQSVIGTWSGVAGLNLKGGAAARRPGHEGRRDFAVLPRRQARRLVDRGRRRCSLVGRFFVVMARVVQRTFAGSGVFGLRHVGSRGSNGAGILGASCLSRPYLRARAAEVMRAAAPSGLTGPRLGADRGGRDRSRRPFGGGAWVLVAGAGLFALGCGRLGAL